VVIATPRSQSVDPIVRHLADDADRRRGHQPHGRFGSGIVSLIRQPAATLGTESALSGIPEGAK
jgi:hypothetical protein